MINFIYSFIIFSFLFNLNGAEKCTYTIPTNGYTTTYEIECSKSNTGGSGTNVPTQSQVFYDPTYYNNGNNNNLYGYLGSNRNVVYYTDTNGHNYQFTNNNQPCNCGTINCHCTNTLYYYPSSGGSSGCYGNDCLTYIILNKK